MIGDLFIGNLGKYFWFRKVLFLKSNLRGGLIYFRKLKKGIVVFKIVMEFILRLVLLIKLRKRDFFLIYLKNLKSTYY